MQPGFQNHATPNQPMNLAQQAGGPQVVANAMFPGDLHHRDT